MNTNTMRNALLISIAVVLAMIMIVLLLSIGEANAFKRTLTFLFVLGPIAYLILLWMRTLHLMRSDTASVNSTPNSPVDDGGMILFHTGQMCDMPGTYRCTQHESREVTMSEGKRFPPCKGEGKGHSADWMRI
ncbi:MAG: hypothetical protein JXK93_06470 [Sphaerochaetaceae bacterium]|nr:hypothetical protein [Sphaerochaetaceae bacterium]